MKSLRLILDNIQQDKYLCAKWLSVLGIIHITTAPCVALLYGPGAPHARCIGTIELQTTHPIRAGQGTFTHQPYSQLGQYSHIIAKSILHDCRLLEAGNSIGWYSPWTWRLHRFQPIQSEIVAMKIKRIDSSNDSERQYSVSRYPELPVKPFAQFPYLVLWSINSTSR